MSISAPPARFVNALTGAKAPDAFRQALSEADDFCRELAGLRELQARVDELTAERDDLVERLRTAENELAQVRVDRDTQRVWANHR